MELRDVIKLRKAYENRFAAEQVVTNAEIVARNGSTKVPGVPNHYWVVPLGEGEPVAVYNRNVKATRPGLAVQIGYAPYSTVLEILRTVVDANSVSEDTEGVNMEPHAGSHRVDGDDPLFIETRAITALLTYPIGQTGLSVHITNYTYVMDDGVTFAVFPGYQFFDLTSHKPVSGSRLALIYLDKATNLLGVEDGVTIALDSPSFIPPAPALPSGAIPVSFVRLGASSTQIGWQDIIEARNFLGGGGGGSGWKLDNVIVVGPSGDYATITEAIAAASVGQIILVDAGTYNESITVNKQVAIISLSPGKTIITSSAETTVWITTISVRLRGLVIYNTNADALARGIRWGTNDVEFHDLYINMTGLATAGYALHNTGASVTLMRNVRAYSYSATTSYAYANTVSSGSAVLDGGEFRGGNADIYTDQAGAFLWARDPTFYNGSAGVSFVGTAKGQYLDTNANRYTFAGTGESGGAWRHRADGLRVKYDILDAAMTACTAGDKIKLGPGTYTLTASLAADVAIEIEGDGKAVTFITCATDSIPTIDATANLTLRNLTVLNTGAGAGAAGPLAMDDVTVILDNADLKKLSGATGIGYGVWMYDAGELIVKNGSNIQSGAGSLAKYGIMQDLNNAVVFIGAGCEVGGTTQDIYGSVAGSTLTIDDAVMTTSQISWAGTKQGSWKSASGVVTFFADIFPQASANGLNTRFERLFGDDVPTAAYKFTNRVFRLNDFGNHQAGFEDSQGNPYSFGGGSPPFSISAPASNFQARSDTYRHYLWLQNNDAATPLYLQWTSSTGKNNVTLIFAFGPNSGLGGDSLACEIRFWAVQSPGAGDNYWAWRFNSLATTTPDYKHQMEMRRGAGVTLGAADGTLITRSPYIPGQMYYAAIVIDQQANPRFNVQALLGEGFTNFSSGTQVAAMPNTIKTMRIYLPANTFGQFWLDEIILT